MINNGPIEVTRYDEPGSLCVVVGRQAIDRVEVCVFLVSSIDRGSWLLACTNESRPSVRDIQVMSEV